MNRSFILFGRKNVFKFKSTKRFVILCSFAKKSLVSQHELSEIVETFFAEV